MSLPPIEFTLPRDVEGWLNPPDAAFLFALARGRNVLEVGSYCGLSTIVMAKSAKHIYCIDPFDSRFAGTDNKRDTLKEFRANLRRHRVQNFTFHKGTVEAYALNRQPHMPAFSTFDMVFIDAEHSYAAVKRQIELIVPHLASGSIIAFHDYREHSWPEVTTAVDEWRGDRLALHVGTTLAVTI